jgi:hypothetical protein
MSEVQTERVDLLHDGGIGAPLMVHWTVGDSIVALCGTKLKGIDYPYSTPVDCVVCEDLSLNLHVSWES